MSDDLQMLAIDVGAALERLPTRAEESRTCLRKIVDRLDSGSLLKSNDPFVAGGSHLVHEVARAAARLEPSETMSPCSRECAGSGGRFCDAVAVALCSGKIDAARGLLDDFANKIRGDDLPRHEAILHYATYLCLGFEEVDDQSARDMM